MDPPTVVHASARSHVRRSILETLDACDAIRTNITTLVNDVDRIGSEPFERNIVQIACARKEIDATVKRLRDVSHKKLSERISKRKRLKLNRVKRAVDKSDRNLSIVKQTTEIDDWIRGSADERDKKQKADEFKLKTDSILKDVNRRKTEAKRFLFLMDRLCDLRRSREKSAIGRGEAIDSSEKESFYSSIEKLCSFWKAALDDYTREKISSSEEIKNETVVCCDSEIQNSRLLSNRWKTVMFGDSDLPPQQSVPYETFIIRRKKWDQFVCIESDGAKIPLGWLVPSALTDTWKTFVFP